MTDVLAQLEGFKAGDRVEWSSQAAGSWKTKVGEVVQVIPANRVTSLMRELGLGAYNTRNHESYIVHVASKSGRGKGTYYWPLVSKLRKV